MEGGTGEGIEEAGRDSPGEELIGTEDVGYSGDLTPESLVGLVGFGGSVILEAMGFDEGEEGPAEVGLGAGGENERDDEAFGGDPGFGEKAGEAGAEAGGIEDKVAGLPVIAKLAEGLIEIGVGDTLPAEAGYDAVERERRGGGLGRAQGGGGSDFDDSEGGEVVGEGRFSLTPGPSPEGRGERG